MLTRLITVARLPWLREAFENHQKPVSQQSARETPAQELAINAIVVLKSKHVRLA